MLLFKLNSIGKSDRLDCVLIKYPGTIGIVGILMICSASVITVACMNLRYGGVFAKGDIIYYQ